MCVKWWGVWIYRVSWEVGRIEGVGMEGGGGGEMAGSLDKVSWEVGRIEGGGESWEGRRRGVCGSLDKVSWEGRRVQRFSKILQYLTMNTVAAHVRYLKYQRN